MSDQNGTAATLQTLPVLLAPARPTSGRGRSEAVFSAQVLGAGGARRGLKGGAPVLKAALSAYLQAQWSGGDRRAAVGSLTRTRV